MGLQMSFDPGKGTVFSEGYIKISQMLINKDESLKIHTLWYKNKAARDSTDPIYGTEDQKGYIVSSADYSTYFSNEALDIVNQNQWERAYTYLTTEVAEFSTAITA